MVEHEDFNVQRGGDAPGGGPTAPGVVQQKVILPVVGQEHALLLGGDQELLVIAGAGESCLLSSCDVVTGHAMQGGEPK